MNRITRLALVGLTVLTGLVAGSTPALAITAPIDPSSGGAGQPALTQVQAGTGVPVWIALVAAMAIAIAVLIVGYWAGTRAGRARDVATATHEGVAAFG